MQFEITRTSNGPLPLITAIPDFGVAQLEGYNGVGKTLTIHLLEVCSGKRPPLPVEVWKSFCAGLGELTVCASGLAGAHEVVWKLDGVLLLEASTRPDGDASSLDGLPADDAPPADDWFVSITRDKEPVSIEDVRELFVVERIAGDRGLIEMLAEEAESAARDLTRVDETVMMSPAREALEDGLRELESLFASFSSSTVRDHRLEAEQAREEREAANAVMSEAVRRSDALTEIAAIRARVSTISEEAVELEAKLSAVNIDIADTRAARDAATRTLSAAETEAEQSDEARGELAKAERQYKRATSDRERLSGELAQLESVLGIPSGSDEAVVAQRLAEIEEDLLVLDRRRNEINAAPGVAKLVDSVHPSLTGAIVGGLGEVELLRRSDDPGNAWTVNEVSDGLARRKEELGSLPTSREAVGLGEEIDQLRLALATAKPIEEKRHRLQLAIERQDAAQTRAAELSVRLDVAVAANLKQLRGERRRLDDRLYELTAERTILQYRRDAIGSPEERDLLSARLAHLLNESGVTVDSLETALAEAMRQADIERDAFNHVQERDRAASAQLERDSANVRALISRLCESESLAWVRESPTQESLPSPDDPFEAQLSQLDRFGEAVTTVQARLDRFRGLALGLRQTLRELAGELRTAQSSGERREAYWGELRRALESRAEEWFANEEVRSVLLEGASSEVEVDLGRRQVSWKDTTGNIHVKPLEALSSGEQAFAFTQAQLVLFDYASHPSANRLIVLDEFGAFVSVDRLGKLRRYLHNWHEKHQHDQILVILPASQNYEDLAAMAPNADQRKRFERMSTSLSERQWFVEELEP